MFELNFNHFLGGLSTLHCQNSNLGYWGKGVKEKIEKPEEPSKGRT